MGKKSKTLFNCTLNVRKLFIRVKLHEVIRKIVGIHLRFFPSYPVVSYKFYIVFMYVMASICNLYCGL